MCIRDSLYAKRRAALALVLAKRLKNLVTIYGVSAGMHMILQFDQSLPVAKILRCICEAGVPMVSTEKHYVGDPKPHEFMIGFAHHSEAELSARVEHFADLLSVK